MDATDASTKAARGIPLSALRVGLLITVSQNKVTGDRSFTADIWEIIGINASHLLLRASRNLNTSPKNADAPRLVALCDHEFYSAIDLAASFDEHMPSSKN